MEEERRINWISLFIKAIIIFTFILIIIWLISKIVEKNKFSDTFKSNINNMETAAVKYFKSIDLPLEEGKSIKITLGEMVEKDKFESISSGSNKKCDTEKSYSKITRKKDNYEVETRLECGKEKNTITRKFNIKDCQNCNTNNNADNINNTNNENNTNSNNVNNNNTNTTNNNTKESDDKLTYYEYVKETTSYSKWVKGNKTGNNIENKYEYYSISEETYYSLGAVSKNNIKNNTIKYTLVLNNVSHADYYFTLINNSAYYSENDLVNYKNEKNVFMKDSNKFKDTDITKYALKDNNFTYKLYPYYHDGKFYVDVKLNIKSLNNVKLYNDNYYLVPIKFNIRFNSGKILTTKPESDYETISYYRYVETNKDVVWSTESSLEGYTKTGNTKLG